MSKKSEWCTQAEAAKILGVSRVTAGKYARELRFGECRAFGRQRIQRASVERYKAENSPKKGPQ